MKTKSGARQVLEEGGPSAVAEWILSGALLTIQP